MVHDKKRSGDPDYDDKQPLSQQLGEIVTAPDGQAVRISESTGPSDVFGAHISMDDPKGDELDNRPAPGGVAEAPSEVQTYDAPKVQGAMKVTMDTDGPKAPSAAGEDDANKPTQDSQNVDLQQAPAKKATPAAKRTSNN